MAKCAFPHLTHVRMLSDGGRALKNGEMILVKSLPMTAAGCGFFEALMAKDVLEPFAVDIGAMPGIDAVIRDKISATMAKVKQHISCDLVVNVYPVDVERDGTSTAMTAGSDK
ncbi:hypothetical protein GGF32_001417 [Allomyces javanicus]|nr:hypothetical protein GGF32_001417 [Allomyces javanicus]